MPTPLDMGQLLPFNPRTQVDPVDALSEILGSFGVAGSLFCRARYATPWSVHSGVVGSGVFHVIVEGEAHIQLEDEDRAQQLGAGDIAFLPHCHPHVMSSAPGLAPVPVASLTRAEPQLAIAEVDYPGKGGGDGQGSCAMLCGLIRFADERGHPLVKLLPPLMIVRRAKDVSGWLDLTVRMLAAEARRPIAGGAVMGAKLAEMLFVQLMRNYVAGLAEEEAPVGWIAGLEDPRIAKALAAIHGQPELRWTGAGLARHVGMSRSAFFARFAELVGEPPTQYLTAWRMHLATLLLREGQLSLAEVADRVGYTSESAFSKAFKRTIGRSPSELRLAERKLPATA